MNLDMSNTFFKVFTKSIMNSVKRMPLAQRKLAVTALEQTVAALKKSLDEENSKNSLGE